MQVLVCVRPCVCGYMCACVCACVRARVCVIAISHYKYNILVIIQGEGNTLDTVQVFWAVVKGYMESTKHLREKLLWLDHYIYVNIHGNTFVGASKIFSSLSVNQKAHRKIFMLQEKSVNILSLKCFVKYVFKICIMYFIFKYVICILL